MTDEIRQIQRMLREISFYDEDIERLIPDGIYGEDTKNSVKSFQRKNNLYETGVVDNDTWDKITLVYEEILAENKREVPVRITDNRQIPLEVGNSSQSLFVIQAMLVALSEYFDNLNAVEVNGVFDSKTLAAVEQIQAVSGINPSGVIDRTFLNALSEIYNVHITNG